MRGRVGVAIAALIGMTGTTAVHAQAGATSAADDAAAFGTRESVQQISLSPDGTESGLVDHVKRSLHYPRQHAAPADAVPTCSS